ncbi:MAG: pectate lyase [Fibrobacteres bacterium]|nr:pectate lyase [Fibrobacterota bacterium]
MNTRLSIASLLAGALALQAQTVSIKEASGWIESAQVRWQTSGNPDSHNVYVSGQGLSNQQLDAKLIRNYGGYWRADAIGLKAGSYTMTVAPVTSGKEGAKVTTTALEVTAHNRAGFAFSGGRIPGAYNLDGTPMTGAVIVYVSDKSKDTVSLNVTGASTNPCVGLQNILYGFKKGKDTRPLIVRVIGQVKDMAVMDGGDLVIENANLATGHITLEGVGDDAVADGWGIRLKNASNIEVRNLGIMNVNSSAGDDIGLQQDNDHVWIHHTDYFYGDAGSDADQVKGDGAMDVKKSTYVTISYNHFWDNGKASLLGLSENTTTGLYIDYHHNWFDHSDSRHPRVRFYSAHVYNNFYDGVAKYGAGSTMGSSIFMEGNYFRNCKHPMMTSMQGTDVWNETTKANDYKDMGTFSSEAGGTIKAWNNFMEGQERFVPYGSKDFVNSTVDFDAYVASSRTEKVPVTVKSAYGANTYNNFDTDNTVMHAYTADAPEAAMSKVVANAGRMGGGDLGWTFRNGVDDSSSVVNSPLKAALVAYKSALIHVQGEGTNNPSSVHGASKSASNPIHFEPNTRKLSVEAGWTMRSGDIRSLEGARVGEWTGAAEVDLSGLRSGVYLARVRTDRGTYRRLFCSGN